MKKSKYILFFILLNCCFSNFIRAQYYTIAVNLQPEICGTGSANIAVSGGKAPYFYNWDDGGTGSYRANLIAGNYHITIIDSTGRDTSITIAVLRERCPVSLPPAFTPNGDGINDVLSVTGAERFPDFLFQVFNRWGQKVHEQRGGDKYIPWDGKQFGLVNVPDESYYYIFYYDEKDKSDIKSGSVSIVR